MIQHTDHILSQLPLILTEIQVQKKNNNRFSLFSNNIFLIGISSKTLIDFSLKKGIEITPELWKQIVYSEEFENAKSSCFRYLERRDHASFEIRQKLRKKGYNNLLIDDLIHELCNKNFLNDSEFALKFATDKTEINKWGPKKIEAALFQKNIEPKIVQKTMKKIIKNLSQDQICVDLALKKKKQFLREADPQKRKQKIFNFLSGRGFSGSVIIKSLPIITAGIDAEKSDT